MSKDLTARVATCQAVLFDFAGTLFDERSLRKAMLENLRWLSGELGLALDDDALRAAYKRGMREAFIAYSAQSHYRHDDFFGDCYRFAFIGTEAGSAAGLIAEAVRRQNHNTATHLELRPHCLEVLAGLRAAGKHVQVVSNFDEAPLVQALQNSGVMNVVDTWTSSEAAGSCKPHPDIFHVALQKAGCSAGKAIYVGDAPMHDVAGAHAAGLDAVLLDPRNRHATISVADWRPEFRITDLNELWPATEAQAS